MRQTRAGIDNALERTLNGYWNVDREVQLSEEWIGTTRFQILRVKFPERHTRVNGRPTKSAEHLINLTRSGAGSSTFRPKTQTTSTSSPKLEQNSKHAWFVQDCVFPWRVLEGRTVLQIFCRSQKLELTLISK